MNRKDTTREMTTVAEVKETLPLLSFNPIMGWRNRLRIANKGSSSSSDAEVPAHHDEKRAKSVPTKNSPDNVTKSTTSTSTSATTQTLPKPKKKQVHFSDVNVRVYNRILGDNPYVEIPLSIGWEYSVEEPSSVEDHQARQFEPDYANASGMEPMEQAERMQKLESVGIPKEVIRRGERRRKIQIVKEWTYRMDPADVTPCTCHYGQILIQRYLMA